MCNVFDQEFFREMNFKADLLRKTETLRKSDNLKYSKLVEKHKAKYRKLYLLPIKILKDLVGEI